MPVYLIRAGASGPVKIGKADRPFERMAELQTAHYERLEFLRVWEGGLAEETALRAMFADLHIRNEWYSFSRRMLGDDLLPMAVVPVLADRIFQSAQSPAFLFPKSARTSPPRPPHIGSGDAA